MTALILLLYYSGAQANVGWGTFNPGSLFSVRARVPNSPLIGIGWSREDHVGSLRFGVGDPSGPTFFRYHDGRRFAEESITDKDAGVIVTATWVLLDSASWAIRVRADPLEEQQTRRLNIFVYTSIVNDTLSQHENQPAQATLHVFDKKDGVHLTADKSSVGAFRVQIREPFQGAISSGKRSYKVSGSWDGVPMRSDFLTGSDSLSQVIAVEGHQADHTIPLSFTTLHSSTRCPTDRRTPFPTF